MSVTSQEGGGRGNVVRQLVGGGVKTKEEEAADLFSSPLPLLTPLLVLLKCVKCQHGFLLESSEAPGGAARWS